jgi:hypothetical protein
METEVFKEYYFQDNNERLIFRILAETLNKKLDRILEANQIEDLDATSQHAVFSSILQSSDPKELDHVNEASYKILIFY